MEQSSSWEADSSLVNQEAPGMSVERECSLPCTQRPVTCPCTNRFEPNPFHPISFTTHLNVSLPVTQSSSGFFPSCFPIEILHVLPSPHIRHTSSPPHPPRFHHACNRWWRIQIRKILFLYSFPLLCHLILLRPKYFPEHILDLCFSLNMREQDSHP